MPIEEFAQPTKRITSTPFSLANELNSNEMTMEINGKIKIDKIR